jgi:hypothetical protein
MNRLLALAIAFPLALCAAPAAAFVLSTTSTADLGALHFGSGDLVETDPLGIALHPADWFAGSANIDAVARWGNVWLVSTVDDETTLGGLTVRDGDLVALEPLTGNASIWFGEGLFAADEDLDAADLWPDGRLLLSTTTAAVLGGLGFAAGDLALYDPRTATAALYWRGADWFVGSENIDAVATLRTGELLVSTATDGTTKAGLSFRDGDVLRFDGSGLSLWWSEAHFAADEDIDALDAAIPAPGTLGLLALGLAAGAMRRLVLHRTIARSG